MIALVIAPLHLTTVAFYPFRGSRKEHLFVSGCEPGLSLICPAWSHAQLNPLLWPGEYEGGVRLIYTSRTEYEQEGFTQRYWALCQGAPQTPHGIAIKAVEIWMRVRSQVYRHVSEVPCWPHTGSCVRVLANECIKKLCPVYAHSNGSVYVMALTTGKREGYVHFGTITGKGWGLWRPKGPVHTLASVRIPTSRAHPSPGAFRRGPRLEVVPVSGNGFMHL